MSAPIDSAIKLCEDSSRSSKFMMPAGPQLYMNIYREAGDIKPFEQVPALVTRFAGSQPAGRGSLPSSYVSFPLADGGALWAVIYQTQGCDLMATGLGDPVPVVNKIEQVLAEKSYTVLRSVDASAQRPLAQKLLLKRDPQPDSPAYGTRVKIEALASSAADRDGVQLSVSFLSGDIQVPQATATTPKTPKP
ncbi:hypothetical protein BXU08_17760 [Sphingomonas sp. LM7]|nr:hypothetical protein BXU08_17760 [Sphingomonas sp. LM7]